jgi:hypothetical protein
VQELHAEVYENNKQYETAYLARWSILEKFVKTVATEYRRDFLRKSLAGWTDYLDGRLKQKPRKPNTILESNSLPQEKEFRVCLNYFGFDAGVVWNLMDSNGRFRKRRNDIAHKATRFGIKTKYAEMKPHMVDLITSIYRDLK